MATLPSGFVSRTKGKVSFGSVMPFQEQIVETLTSTGGGTYTMYPGGVSILRSTAAASFFVLPVPEAGTIKTFVVSTMSSHAAIKTSSTGAGGVFVDSTTATMLAPSTTALGIMTWRLMAISSVLWVTIGNSTIGSTAGWGTSS